MGPNGVFNIEVEVFHRVFMYCHIVEHIGDVKGENDGAVEAPFNRFNGRKYDGGIILGSCIDSSHVYCEAIEYPVFIWFFCVAVVYIINCQLLFFFLLQVFVCFCWNFFSFFVVCESM